MSITATVKSQPLQVNPSVDAAIDAIARRCNPAVLDSADVSPKRGRYTILAYDPIEVASWRTGASDPFKGMQNRLAQIRVSPPSEDTASAGSGFTPGWIGYFAYEAGRYIERLPATTTADIPLPVARFALYDTAAVHDASANRWTLVGLDLSGTEIASKTSRPIEERFAEWTAILEEAKTPALNPPPPPEIPTDNMTKAQYLQMVSRAKEYIAAGDIFQVNLARRETFKTQEPAISTYLRLRHTNPGAYASFLSWQENDNPAGQETAILSASPELFLQLRDRQVVTRPIKGTRPCSPDPYIDAAWQCELSTSPKDRAELAMIVDLERNDLGRVCEYGSIRVLASDSSPAYPYELEQHPTVHHLAGTVTGQLAEPYDMIDLLRACFPGGSITGAPKVRAMEIVDELEPTERSVYTGAIGYLGLDGSMMLNIAIRTMILTDQRIHIYAGGGIVADSVPEDEYEETRAKVLGLCRALGVAQEYPTPRTSK